MFKRLLRHKKLILMVVVTMIVVNASIFGTLKVIDYLAGPSAQEVVDARRAEVDTQKAAIYADLPPLSDKSRIGYIANIGQAIELCEEKLHSVQAEGKSWDVNMIESRYVASTEMYLIFLEYQTLAKKDQPSKAFHVTCDVSAERKAVENWMANPL